MRITRRLNLCLPVLAGHARLASLLAFVLELLSLKLKLFNLEIVLQIDFEKLFSRFRVQVER